MEHSKSLWRGLFFILLITALCGGLALPAMNSPARAAPQMANALDVVINEVAWSGTSSSTTGDEWIELYNSTSANVDLSNWIIVIVGGTPITIPSGKTILANGYFLLERNDNAISDITADYVYGGSNLSNSGEKLELHDSSNNLIDSANSNGGGWPAGTAGSGSLTYASMERVSNLIADSDSNWATNNGLVRNGLNQSSNPINGTPKQPNSATLAVTATA